MPQTLPVCEELLEIHGSYFTAEEKPPTDQSPHRHPVCMVDSSEYRRDCLHPVSDTEQSLVFLRPHNPFLLCTLMRFYGNGNGTDTFMDLCLAPFLIPADRGFLSRNKPHPLRGCSFLPVPLFSKGCPSKTGCHCKCSVHTGNL